MYLTAVELDDYYDLAENMDQGSVTTYLKRANAWAKGIIGGPLSADDIPAELGTEDLKTAVALAFEEFATDDEGQVNEVTGNVTAAAPTGQYVKHKKDPLTVAAQMLQPYSELYAKVNAENSNRGMFFA